jgi:glycerol kinase
MQYILSLDQGTTSSRAILFDQQGRMAALAQKEFSQKFPQPGWVEHDPEEIWASQIAVAKEVLAKTGAAADSVAAVGITNQRETAVVWDRADGRPIYNAIVWQDRRTADLCDQLKQRGYEPMVRQKTGLLIDPYFSATKIKWILDHVKGARQKAQAGRLAFGTIDTWLMWKLTGGRRHITDATNASRTLLYDIHTGRWDDDLLDLFEIPRAILPEVVSSSPVDAHTDPALFGRPIPVSGVAGDQQAALLGQLCCQKGAVKNTYGTGCFMLLNTGQQPVSSANKLITTIAWNINGQTTYALEGSVFIAGAVVQWLRDGLKFIRSAPEIEALAASVPDCGGVYFVPAFVGLGAPYWDPYARGAVLGITRDTTAAHIARAALESIAHQVADVLEAMSADSGIPITQLRVDGGAAADNLLLQTQADFLQIPVGRPKVLESTARGAAYLAGLAVNFWPSMEALADQCEMDRIFYPQMNPQLVSQKRARWKQAVLRSKNWNTDR